MRRNCESSQIVGTVLVAWFASTASAQQLAPEVITAITTSGQPWMDDAGREFSCSPLFATVDALWLKRDYPNDFLIAQTVNQAGNPIPGTVISLNDVRDNSTDAGTRIWLGYRLSECTTVEAGYFGLQSWSKVATITVQDPPFAQSPFLGSSVPFGNKSFDSTLTVRYDSRIHSAELNVKRSGLMSDWNASALVGFRYFRLSEAVDLNGIEAAINTVEVTRTEVENDLFGAQVGGEISRFWLDDCVGLAVNGKVGILANSANQFTTNRSQRTGLPVTEVLQAGRGTTDFASLYEGSISTTIRLTPHVTIRGGYQLLFVQGLALAPDQLALTGSAIRNSSSIPNFANAVPIPVVTGSRIKTDGDMFLHGPFVGMEISY